MSNGHAPEEGVHLPLWMSWLLWVSKFVLTQPYPDFAWTTVPTNYSLAFPVNCTLTESRSPSTSCGRGSSCVVRKGRGGGEWSRLYTRSSHFGSLSKSLRSPRVTNESGMYYCICHTCTALRQLKSKTAVDFIDCSTNHVSKHSCNPFQNMPSLTHSLFQAYECWSNC